MISVGCRDGIKRIGLGLEMDEIEVEEGEALSYNNEAQDSTIDPDIALSYIGEKLQSVLGHFQKDFEGGVSAENLGAKFGGYGSFLPTYQRSPSWSHTRSPSEAYNYERSPKKLHVEDKKQNSFASSNASPLAKPRAASGKAVLAGTSLKGNNGNVQPKHVEESSLKSGGIKKSINSSDQRTLKVRIKVGSENLPTQKNADIYSGLGLVLSPSSSLDDSPTTNEGHCGKITDVPEASPTSILQLMTSFHGEVLLSPLSEDLILFTGKRKLRGKDETKLVDTTRAESSVMSVNVSHSSKSNQRKSKLPVKDDISFIELANQKNNGNVDNNGSLLKKEKSTVIDTLGCEELVSDALKLPLLSSCKNIFPDPAKDNLHSRNTVKDGVRGETFSAFTEKEHLDNGSAQDIDEVENLSGKIGSSGKNSESKKGNHASYIAAEVPRAETTLTLDQSESIVSKGRKSDPGLKPALEKPSSGGKRKQKVAQNTDAQGAHSSKNDSRDLQKDHAVSGDRYKDFFGDIEFEQENNESISGEMTSSGRFKHPQIVGKRSSSDDHNSSKENLDGKNPEKPPQVPVNNPGLASQSAPPLGDGSSSEAPSGSVPLVEEDWVSCDKCQKWRLLPLGTNLKSLPDKWLCRMLTWLPGMNRCSVPQEETTNALRALYHPAAPIPGPTSVTQHSQVNNISLMNSVQMTSVDAVQTSTISEKKKHGSTRAANSTDQDGSTNSSNSRKKSLGTSVKISNLNSGKNSPSLDVSGHQHMRQSSSAVEKYSDPKNEKSSLANSSDKGTNSKISSKREADVEGPRASKRVKSEELHFDDDTFTSDNGGPSSKAGRGSASFSNNTSANDTRKYNGHNNLIESKKDVVLGNNTSDNGLLFPEKCDDKDSVKKRKAKEQSDHRKDKKARISKSGGKDEHNGQYPINTRAVDYLKSDLGSVIPSIAANSSSSKVSGSHKNKNNGWEVKGSPVESVSSSPLRYANADKITLPLKKLVGKDDFHDSVSLTVLNPRDERDMVKKDAVLTVKDPVKHSSEQLNAVVSSEQLNAVEEKENAEESQKKKSGKGLSSHSKDKARASVSDLDKVHNSSHDSLVRKQLYDEKEKPKGRKNKSDEKSGTGSKSEKFNSKKDSGGGTLSESSKGQNRKKFGHDGKDAIKSQDKKHSTQPEHNNEKLPKKVNQAEVNGRGKSNPLPPLVRNPTEPVSGPHKENGVKNPTSVALDNGDLQKAPIPRKKVENSNCQPIRHPTPNSHKVRDVDAPSPTRRDSSSHAANSALKEAKDLKHLADRLKNSGSAESNGFYFQAALKFLHGASLLESGSSEATKHSELLHSMHIYSSTAKLCEFCAHEYEKSKEMAAAALAYKCMEVAFLRVVYSSHNSTSRDRIELQTALQIAPPGESPSSSASDVDNLNHQAITDKAALAKVVGSPQVSGSHIITSRNRAGFLRILNFAQDVNFAMEASRKSRIAFTAATSTHKESISSLKNALDFTFQDVEGLLRLVRIAVEAINR